MSRGLCSALDCEGLLGNGDALVTFAHTGGVQVECADLLLHLRGGPFGERLPFTFGSLRKLAEPSSFFPSSASARTGECGPQVSEHGLLDTLRTDASRTRTDTSRVTTPATVDPVMVAVDGALETVAAPVATEQAGEKVRAGMDDTDVSSLRELPSGGIDNRLMGVHVHEAPILTVGEFAQVDAIAEHPVDGGLAPGARTLRRGDARAFKDACKLDRPSATDTGGEDFRNDGCGQRVRFEASVVTSPVADSDAVSDGYAVLDGALLRPLEARTGTLANVGGELEQDACLQSALGGRPVGGRVGRVNLAARVSDASDEGVGVLAVTGEAVKPCDDHAGGLALLDAGESLLQSGTLPLPAGLVKVDDYLPYLELLDGGEFTSAPLLLVGGDHVFASAHTTDSDVDVNGRHGGMESSPSYGTIPSASLTIGRETA